MPGSIRTKPLRVMEMKLVHDVHRAATSLPAEAAARPGAPPGELGELRDFAVAALRLLTAAQWAELSRAAMESALAAGVHLQIGLMDEVGDPGDIAAVLAGLPAPAVQALPAMRDRARATLGALRAGRGAAS